jgi:hypothetical protein
MLIFGMTVIGCGNDSDKTIPSDGSYTFNPRPQALSDGKPVAAYLNKVTVSNGYATFYLTSVPRGKGHLSDIPGHWGTGNSKGKVVLQNLGNKDLSYKDVDAESFINKTGQYVSFDSIVGYRFSLSCHLEHIPVVFNEIVLRDPDKADSSSKKLIYTMPGFDPIDFIEMSFADVIAAAGKTGTFSGFYVSEMEFVSQNGRDLTFKTVNGSTSKEMHTKIAATGFSTGQKVRIYYSVYSQYTSYGDSLSESEAWRVYAIEQL